MQPLTRTAATTFRPFSNKTIIKYSSDRKISYILPDYTWNYSPYDRKRANLICDELAKCCCTFYFIFHRGRPASKKTRMLCSVRQVTAPEAKSTVSHCILFESALTISSD